ncbi:MAG TPA: hypothetical protein VGQ65_16520 [Thermoanaerobaculia bacterium]|nr:hypothetical protein [Thermoanaerobaculia bacterium]
MIIFSVKEIKPKAKAPDEVRFQRWVRGAVDESVKQIYGAERFIQSGRHSHVVREEGSSALAYPSAARRRIHRVAVALGGDDHFPVPYGDFGKGFVHVFDERSFRTVLSELDTITDFVEYLSKKEDLLAPSRDVLFGLEEDLLAIYLHQNRSFPSADLLMIEEGSWPEILKRPEYHAKKIADEESYMWDRLIEKIGKDAASGNLEFSNSLDKDEIGLRVMARENRFNRRMLASALATFLEAARANEVRSRMTASPSGVGYVFLAAHPDEQRSDRNDETSLRCIIARVKLDCETIIGIGTERPGVRRGASWDLHYAYIPTLTDEFRSNALKMSDEMGYFSAPRVTGLHEDEYPGHCPGGDVPEVGALASPAPAPSNGTEM